jgi:mono/diheme cytochrome c family protein
MKKLIIIAAAALVAGLVNVNAADAKVIWDKDCAKCHGAEGKGDTKMGQKLAAKDYTDAKVQAEMKDADMIKAIKDGVKEKDSDKTKMKAFPDLTEEEQKALVAYIRAMKK